MNKFCSSNFNWLECKSEDYETYLMSGKEVMYSYFYFLSYCFSGQNML